MIFFGVCGCMEWVGHGQTPALYINIVQYLNNTRTDSFSNNMHIY